MTLFDLINSLPTWGKVIAYGLLICWAFEMFLFPFKFNLLKHRVNELFDLQKKTLDALERRTIDLESTNKMLAAVLGSLLRREQEEERARNKNKGKDVK